MGFPKKPKEPLIWVKIFLEVLFFLCFITGTGWTAEGEVRARSIKVKRISTEKRLGEMIRNLEKDLEDLASQSLWQEIGQRPTHIFNSSGTDQPANPSRAEPKTKDVQEIIQSFLFSHPEVEELMVKNSLTGQMYYSWPQGALGDCRPGRRINLTVPILAKEQKGPSPLLLIAFVDMEMSNGPIEKLKGDNSASVKQLAIYSFWIFLVLSIVLPISMALLYRHMKRKLSPYLSLSSPAQRCRAKRKEKV